MELDNMYTDVQISRIWQLLFMPLMLVPWIMDHAAHCKIHP